MCIAQSCSRKKGVLIHFIGFGNAYWFFVKEMCHLNGEVACEKEIFEWCFVKSLTVRPVVKQTLVL